VVREQTTEPPVAVAAPDYIWKWTREMNRASTSKTCIQTLTNNLDKLGAFYESPVIFLRAPSKGDTRFTRLGFAPILMKEIAWQIMMKRHVGGAIF
jgi:hypothetical protein